MTNSINQKTVTLFFLLLSGILVINILESELYFLVKLFVGIISLGSTLIIFYLLRSKSKNFNSLKKRLIIFIFLTISFLMFISTLIQQSIPMYLEEKVTGGVVLFLIYIAFFVIFKVGVTVNSLFNLVSLCLIPVFILGNNVYSAETFAVFAFLTQILTALILILDLRKNYEIN